MSSQRRGWLAVAVAAGMAAPLVAQAPPAFEVASVKRAAPGKTGAWIRFLPGGRFVGENVALEFVLQRVYGVRDFQIVASPPLRAIIKDGYGARYEIEGRGREDSTPEQLTEMVKTLLADRFQLKVHKETRDLPVYALTQDPGGVKGARPPDGKGGGIESVAPGWLRGMGTRAAFLAESLSRAVDRPVIDRTNLTDVLDFDLTWTTSETPADTPGCHPSFQEMAKRASRYAVGATASCPSIFTAVREQLGLRLEAQLGPVEVLVIDAVQFPTEN
jgi:uncharacterized protein (TIGR03435 family)